MEIKMRGQGVESGGRALLLEVAFVAFVTMVACGPPPPPPSALLVTIDTLRADRVSVYGSAHAARTSALDALAARGVAFEEALASAPLTLPSHATILSGLEPPRHGLRDNGLAVFPADKDTLATRLAARGYDTAAFVGAYVLDRRFGLARGFATYDDRVERRGEGTSVLESERRCDQVVEAAQTWLARARSPFFAWVHFYDPHAPYDPPSPFREEYAGRLYEGEVAYADSCLGRLLSAAEKAAGSRLVVAVMGDHGESLGEHGEPTHGFFVYQSTLRVPLVMAGPGVPRGERRPGIARTADVAPTLAALLGAETLGLDGSNLFGSPRPREAYAETLYPRSFGWAPLFSYRVGSLKLVEAPRPELFDLAADPGESKDVARARPDDVARLRRALLAFRGDDAPTRAAAPDPEVVERLRALGYAGVGHTAPPPPRDAAPLRDPKDALAFWREFEEASWAEARGDLAQALAGYRRLVVREPDNPVFRRSLAGALRRAGRKDEAVRVVVAAGDDAVLWHERALTLAAAGRIDEAVRSEVRAIALNPGLPEPHNHLAVMQAQRGRNDEAMAALAEALRLDPNNASAWNNQANVLRSLGRLAEAEAAYRRASELAPRDPDPLNGLGVLAVERNDLDGAAAFFERVLALDPAYAEARLNLAVAEAGRGRREVARALARELVKPGTDPGLAAKAQAFLRTLPP